MRCVLFLTHPNFHTYMSMNHDKQNKINCPHCGEAIDVNAVLVHQLEEQMKTAYNKKLAETKAEFDQKNELFLQEKEKFADEKKRQKELVEQELETKLRQERAVLEQQIKLKFREEQDEQLIALKNELDEKSEQVKELYKTKAEIARLQREKEEMKLAVEADLQVKLNETLTQERDKIRKTEEEKNALKLMELQKQLEDQKRLTEEMKRKQEQGSMQLQGEVQELAIEEYLKNTFPLDLIDEVGKGANGADCLQRVNTRERINCGSIYYESKRAKDFKPAWIEKFKEDMRVQGADIGVLVTAVLPTGMERMGMKDGIWVCTLEEFKGLSLVLRQTLVQLSSALDSQENKADKMVMLYDFLTSNAFRMQIEAIVEAFSQMKIDLEKEKRAMKKIWKQRDSQIEKVISSTINMYGSIRGIAGNEIQAVAALELPGYDDDTEEDEED